MRRITLVIFMTAAALVLFACAKTENTSNSNTNSSTTAEKATATPATSTTSTTSTTATASAGDKIGVPECDDFIAKYEACVSGKVPEIARAQYQTAVKQWKDSWKKLAENPQSKGTLAAACKQAREQQEAALKSFGCTF